MAIPKWLYAHPTCDPNVGWAWRHRAKSWVSHGAVGAMAPGPLAVGLPPRYPQRNWKLDFMQNCKANITIKLYNIYCNCHTSLGPLKPVVACCLDLALSSNLKYGIVLYSDNTQMVCTQKYSNGCQLSPFVLELLCKLSRRRCYYST